MSSFVGRLAEEYPGPSHVDDEDGTVLVGSRKESWAEYEYYINVEHRLLVPMSDRATADTGPRPAASRKCG